ARCRKRHNHDGSGLGKCVDLHDYSLCFITNKNAAIRMPQNANKMPYWTCHGVNVHDESTAAFFLPGLGENQSLLTRDSATAVVPTAGYCVLAAYVQMLAPCGVNATARVNR